MLDSMAHHEDKLWGIYKLFIKEIISFWHWKLYLILRGVSNDSNTLDLKYNLLNIEKLRR